MDKVYDELNKEEQFPAQGAYVGHLLTEYLSSLVTGHLADVELIDGHLLFHVDMGQYDEELQLVGSLPLVVTFHRGTIALVCPSEEWWDTMENSILFSRLRNIAEQTGCLFGLSALDTNAARVWDPDINEMLEGKSVMEAPETVQ